MVDHLVIGGKIAMLGIPAKPFAGRLDQRSCSSMLTIKGIYGREMFETWHKMIAMLQSGLDVRKVITHRLPVARVPARASRRCGAATRGKIVLDWTAP